MKTLTAAVTALLALGVATQPAFADLSRKERDRVARADRSDRPDLRRCLEARKSGGRTGAIAGAAVAGGGTAVAGGGVGGSLLAAGAGAVLGNALGKGKGTDRQCDDVLRRNP